MTYTANSSIPTSRDQSYVLLMLAVGTLKRNIFPMISFIAFSPEKEKELVDFGVKVIEGSMTPESYIDKLESICKKEVDKTIKFDDYTKQHLLGRLNLSRAAVTINKTLDKETSKKVKGDGTLKQMTEATSGLVNDPRYEGLPNGAKLNVKNALHSLGLMDEFNDPVTTQKIDFLVRRLTKRVEKSEPGEHLAITRLLVALDPKNWKKYKPEPVVRDFELNSVDKDNKTLLDEAVDKEQVLNILKQKGGVTMLDLLATLGIQPTQPPNGQQVAVFLALKSMLRKGEITRVKEGRGFKYSIASGVPKPTTPTTTPTSNTKNYGTDSSPKQLSKLDKLAAKINELLVKRGYQPSIKVQSNPTSNYIYFLLPDVKTGEYSGEMSIRYYYGGLNKGKYTLRSRLEPEKVLVLSDLKSLLPPKKTKRQLSKEAKLAEVPKILNSNWFDRGTWEDEGRGYYSLETGDRGPRTDHGGGDDGDGWMSPGQIQRVAKPYYDKWNPRLKTFITRLKEKGVKVKSAYVDYGEKGHISLNLELNLDKLK